MESTIPTVNSMENRQPSMVRFILYAFAIFCMLAFIPLFLDNSPNPYRAPNLRRRILDSFMAYSLGFPPKTTRYGIKRLRIPIEKDKSLEADLYTPLLLNDQEIPAKSRGLILIQGCYGRGILMSGAFARPFAARGYTVLFVSTRGTGGSDGPFWPIRHDREDGKKVVEWMRQQNWYPGSFATLGASYLGWTQWSTLVNGFDDCIASAIMVGPHDYPAYYWGTGAMPLDRAVWADTMMAGFVAPPSFLEKIWRFTGLTDVKKAVKKQPPVIDNLKRHFAPHDVPPWLGNIMEHTDPRDEYYKELTEASKVIDKVSHPILIVSGWYDLFNSQSMDQYYRLKERNTDPVLIVGAWNHSEASARKSMGEVFKFISEHVRNPETETAIEHRGYAKIYVSGAEEWREMDVFPPATSLKEFFLHPTKSLELTAPTNEGQPHRFTFDPADPPPTIGGPVLFGGGKAKDTIYASRDDCCVFTSPSLAEPVEFIGQPTIQLSHTTDHPYADLWVRLCQVDGASGESHNICEGYQALEPQRDQSSPVVLKLGHCAHRFKTGTKLRIVIGGGNVPRYARNLGYEENRLFGKKMRSCEHTISFGKGTSRLTLPVTR